MLEGTETADLYAGVSAPVFPFSYLVVLTIVALPLAILLRYRSGLTSTAAKDTTRCPRNRCRAERVLPLLEDDSRNNRDHGVMS